MEAAAGSLFVSLRIAALGERRGGTPSWILLLAEERFLGAAGGVGLALLVCELAPDQAAEPLH